MENSERDGNTRPPDQEATVRTRHGTTDWFQIGCPQGFSRQECWSGLPCPPPGDLPNPGIKPAPPVAPALQADSLPSHRGSP